MARAIVGGCATFAVAVAAFALASVASAPGSGSSWTVTVGSASRTLFPGTEATMPYEVRNATSGAQHLHGTAVEVKPDVAGCSARSFRVAVNDIGSGVDVASGASMRGTVTLGFADTSVAQDACQNIGIHVVVTAT